MEFHILQSWEWPTPSGYPAGFIEMQILLLIGVPVFCCFVIYKFWAKRRETSRPDREIHVRERVLVVCPYCSAKVEQGASFCPHCGGKL